jgi:hypothetical protein
MSSSKLASAISTIGPPEPWMPALLKTWSMRPKRSSATATRASTSAACETSLATTSASPPFITTASRCVLRALLNAQPMGFYAPAQVVRDAPPWRRGTTRLHQHQPPGLHFGADAGAVSRRTPWTATGSWARQRARCGDRSCPGRQSVRLCGGGLAPCRRTARAIERLAEADAFHCLGKDRRQGLWKVKRLNTYRRHNRLKNKKLQSASSPQVRRSRH